MMRQAIIALCVLSCVLLLFFAWMARTRQLTFAILAAKHGWDLQEKAAAMHKAAVVYGALAVIIAFWHLVIAILYKSAFGVAARRAWMQCVQRLARVFASKDMQRSLAGKNSDVSDDDTRDRQSELRALTSPRARSSGGGRAWRGFGALSSSDDVEMSNPSPTNALHIGLSAGGIDPFGFPAPAPPPLPPGPSNAAPAGSGNALAAVFGGAGSGSARFAATSLSSTAAGMERRATPSGGGGGGGGQAASSSVHHTRSGSAGGGTAGLQPRVTGILAPMLSGSPGNPVGGSSSAAGAVGGGGGAAAAAATGARLPPPKVDLDALLSSTGVR